ncbi:hypothetical protein BDQ17DRAFT_1406114 [Cyathus striatus]|nr:hypothetical protein BDQ17DRAFT_1406114 [Cyathus striatus]
MSLPPELYSAIISALWNSILDKVSKQWREDFIRISDEVLHPYSNLKLTMPYIRTIEWLTRCQPLADDRCKRLITFHLEFYGINFYDSFDINTMCRWHNILTPSNFPNLKVVSIELYNCVKGFFGLEYNWTWLEYLPRHVDTLEFVPVSVRYPNLRYQFSEILLNPSDARLRCETVKHLRFYDMENESLAWSLLAPLFPNLQTVEVDSEFVDRPLLLVDRMTKEEYYLWRTNSSNAEVNMQGINNLMVAYREKNRLDIADLIATKLALSWILDSTLTSVLHLGYWQSSQVIYTAQRVQEEILTLQKRPKTCLRCPCWGWFLAFVIVIVGLACGIIWEMKHSGQT